MTAQTHMPVNGAETRGEVPNQRPQTETVADVFLSEVAGVAVAETAQVITDPAQKLLAKAAEYGWTGRIIRNKRVWLPSAEDSEVLSEHSRQRYTIELDINGTPAYFRVTEREDSDENAEEQDADETWTIAHFLGLSEMPDGGSAYNAHNELARQNPDKRIISIGTEGVNRFGTKMAAKEALQHSFEEKGDLRISVLSLIAEADPVVIFDVSMGSAIADHVIEQNLEHQAEDSGWALDIQGVIHHSHARVPKHRVVPDMFMRFPGHMIKGAKRKVQEQPEQRPGYIATALSLRRALPAVIGNIIQLGRGTSKQHSVNAVHAYPTGYISGENDPLAQTKHLLHLQRAGLAHVEFLPDQGHEACMDAEVMSLDVTTMLEVIRQQARNSQQAAAA